MLIRPTLGWHPRHLSPITRLLLLALSALLVIAAQPAFPMIPYGTPEVRSFMARDGVSPLTSHLHYALQLALFVAWMGLAAAWRDDIRVATRAAAAAARWFGWDRLAWIAGATLLAVTLANHGLSDPGATLASFFHEGEWLGLAPSLDGGPVPLSRMFLIHGLGVDALPTAMARALFPDGATIAGARSSNLLLLALFGAALWLVLGELARGAGIPEERVGTARLFAAALLASSFGTLWWHGTLDQLPNRKLVLILQLFLALRLARAQVIPWAVAALLGASVPLGFLWNMGDAAVGAALAAGAAGIAAARRGWSVAPSLALLAGGTAAALASVQLAFPGLWRATVEAVIYWGTYGRDLWSHRIPNLVLDGPYSLGNLAIQAAALCVVGAVALRSGPVACLRTHGQPLLLLLVGLLHMRAPLELGLPHYFGSAGLFAVLLLLDGFFRYRGYASALLARARVAVSPGALAALLLGPPVIASFAPLSTAARLVSAIERSATPDADVLDPATRRAVVELRPLFAGQICTVVLPSSATWLHLIGLPSCSRFYSPIQAATPDAQAELADAIDRHAPELIIQSLPPDDLSMTLSVPLKERLPDLIARVEAQYEPFASVAGVEVWRRRAAP